MHPMTSTAHDAAGVLETIRSSRRFVVQQLFKPIGNEYRISAPPAGSDEGQPLLYVKQKKLRIKEDIRFRLSPDDEAHLFMIKSKTVFEFRGRHEVRDADDQVLGQLEKAFGTSLLRSHWRVRDADGNELFEAHEASWTLAILRRLAEFLPSWLGLLAYLPFNFVLKRGGKEAGWYRRVLGKLRDRYVVEVGDELQDVDRRLVLAFAVALDALQDR